MNLDLRLLGDLQVYDVPYLSLFIDKVTRSFYLAFRLTSKRGPICDYIVVPVSTNKILEYLQQEITLRDIFRESETLLFWHKQRGVKGGLSKADNSQFDDKIDNLKYNPHLCQDEDVIRDYIQNP